MSASIRRRLAALEGMAFAGDTQLQGVIDLLPGKTPLDALADAGVGFWLILDEHDGGCLGEVRRDGTKEIHHANPK